MNPFYTVLILSILLIFSGCSTSRPGSRDSAPGLDLYSMNWELEGDLSAHDPAMIREGEMWYTFYTGSGIKIKSSQDGITWQHEGQVFRERPSWFEDYVANPSSNIWAPDVIKFKDQYYLFYSVSSFGRNESVIGMASNRTLNKKDQDYQWIDKGPVISSSTGDMYNAIDPQIFIDDEGSPWLCFGSFWTGIKLTELDSRTLMPIDADHLISLAYRPDSTAVEAPFIVKHNDYYYLFISFDSCCNGVQSTYKIAVGRSNEIEGPYYDIEGLSMLEGGGSILVHSDDRWKGPGHCGVYESGDSYILYYHAYDAEWNGNPTLRIQALFWDSENWPVLKEH